MPGYFTREHHKLDRLLQAYLLDVVGIEFIRALQRFLRWYGALLDHIETEETRLLPHVPVDARWPARLYRLEHQRIRELAIAHLHEIQAVARHVGPDTRTRRLAALALLDKAQVLRHLLQHHHAREEMALTVELPTSLQAQAWVRTSVSRRATRARQLISRANTASKPQPVQGGGGRSTGTHRLG